MKILFLTSRMPYPPHRGDKLHIWNLLKPLSRRHEIILLTFVRNRQEAEWITKVREVCSEVYAVRLPVWKSLVNCLLAIPRNEPFQVAYYRSRRMDMLVQEQIEKTKPDVIHTHLIRMAQYTTEEKGIPVVLDLTDAVSLYLTRFREVRKNPIAKWLLGVELQRMSRYESIIGTFDRGLVCSNADRRFLLDRYPDLSLSTVPNGVDLEAFSTNGSACVEPFRIIFTGNMTYFPNADGAAYLVREILPKIKRIVPQVKLYLVGQNPPASVQALAGENVVVTGFVEDIRMEYLKSMVAVSPIRFGAGTQYKVLEPLTLGVPVVSSSIGLEGLGLSVGTDILVADDAQGFATAVVRLLTDESLRSAMASRASEKVRRKFSSENISRDLERIYQEVIDL
jgi:sugar transferase (PEP-CTERM/EpsH1 system associated)